VADPTKLIIDLLDSPESGGGISHVIQIFRAYLKSEHKSIEKLLQYATKQSNGAIFKRLGFLLEVLAPTEIAAIEKCKKQITTGYSLIDPNLKSDKIITRWKLWIPAFLKKDLSDD
jgi:predicted transcriptional regulator of viral defense system